MHHSKHYSCFYDFEKASSYSDGPTFIGDLTHLLQLTIYLLCSASLGHVLTGIWCRVSFLALSVWCSVCFLRLVHFSFLELNFFYDFIKNIFMHHFLLCLPLVNFSFVCYPKVLECFIVHCYVLKKNCHWLWLKDPMSVFCLQILMFCLPQGPLLVTLSTEHFYLPYCVLHFPYHLGLGFLQYFYIFIEF